MVYVFKTNIKTKRQIIKLKPHIDRNFLDMKWNFDIEDCDKIFRIESEENILDVVLKIFQTLGYFCEELPD